MSDPLYLLEGYYAIADPDVPATMTYWRRATTRRRQTFGPWPAKASYGPVLSRRDVPVDLDAGQRNGWVARWFRDVHKPWHQRVASALLADPVAAAERFAEFTSRCCRCGRRLTDARSKVYGIGPDCRDGLDAGTLAALYVPRVAAAHGTGRLDEDGDAS